MRDRVTRSDGSTRKAGQRRRFGVRGRWSAPAVLTALCLSGVAGRVWLEQPASADDGSAGGFSFAASGDHGRNNTTAGTLKALGRTETDFYIALGDMSYGGSESSWCNLVKDHVGKEFPFQLVSGNHEEKQIDKFTGCLPDRMGATGGTYGRQYFFDYPEQSPLARFILVSPDLAFPGARSAVYSTDSDRYRWVSDAIDEARSRGIPWVVVGMHKVCITAGVKGCEIGASLFNLLVAKKVDLVLQAHDHNYQRSKQLALGEGCDAIKPASFKPACVADGGADGAYSKGAGPVVVIDGTFGQTLYPVRAKDSEAGYFAKLMGRDTTPTHGFVRYQVTKSRISAEFVASGGGKFRDSFSIGEEAEASPSPSPSPSPISGSPSPTPSPSASPSPSPSPSPGEGGGAQPRPGAEQIGYVGASTRGAGKSAASSLSLGKPSGVEPGDVLLAVIGSDYGHVGTAPQGWKLIRQNVKKGDDLAIQPYYKVAAAGEPDTYSWPLVSGGRPNAKGLGAGSILAFRGVDEANPVFASAVRAQTPDRTKIECPSVEAPSAGVLVCGYMVDDPDTVTMPSGIKEVGNLTVRGDDTYAVGYEQREAAGATGIRAAGMNNVGGGSDDFSHAIVLRPASSG